MILRSGFPRWSRRSFVAGIAGGAVYLAAPGRRLAAAAAPELSGTQFDLEIGEMPVNFTGSARIGTVGERADCRRRYCAGAKATRSRARHQRLAARTSIHWHGIIVPADMDGVPGISFHGIAAAARRSTIASG